MKERFRHGPGSRNAFTLLELLVAVAVLSLLCVLLTRLTADTQGVARTAMRQMDANGQAQLALDRLGMDWNAIIARADAPCELANAAAGTASLQFLSRTPSDGGSRGISVVSFRVAEDTTSGSPATTGRLCLQRASKGADWAEEFLGVKEDGSPLAFADLAPSLQVADGDYDILAPGVIRMALRFQLRQSGAITDTVPQKDGRVDFTDLAGLIVSLVVLDGNSMALLTPSQVEEVSGRFPNPAAGVLPAETWDSILRNPANFPGLPHTAVQALRIYQQFFPLRKAAP